MYLEYIIFFMLKAEVCIKNNSNIHLYNHGKIFKFRMFNIPEITQVLVNFFCKRPNCKYFKICGPHGLCHNYSALS